MLLHTSAILRAGINRVRKLAGAEPLGDKVSVRAELKQAGQIVVIFALMLTVLIGLVGIAIDATYAWRESLQIQRAADAASLAGVVYMPGNSTLAQSTATAEAQMNGFPSSTSVISFPPVFPANPRELDVSITTQVPTFFSRIFGINSFTVSRLSKSVYVTPVPMGSPLAYYGVYQLCNVTSSCSAEGTNIDGGGNLSVTGGLASQGFFGAALGEGSNKGNGDAFDPYYDGNLATLNNQYTSDGVRYQITAASNGSVYLFDPLFCATAAKTGT